VKIFKIKASEGSFPEYDYENRILETLRQLGIKVEE